MVLGSALFFLSFPVHIVDFMGLGFQNSPRLPTDQSLDQHQQQQQQQAVPPAEQNLEQGLGTWNHVERWWHRAPVLEVGDP